MSMMRRLLPLAVPLLSVLAFAQTHVQGNSVVTGAGVTTSVLVLPSNPTAGNMVAACWAGGTVTNLVCADGNSNTYTNTPGSPNTHLGQNVWLLYLLVAPANADKNITCNWTTATTADFYGDEFSVIAGQKFTFDQDQSSNGNTGTNINTPSITGKGSAPLLYACAVSQAGITAPTAGGGTLGVWTGVTGPARGSTMAEYCLICTGANAVSFTQPNNDIWTAMAMSFYMQPPELQGGGAKLGGGAKE